MKVSISKAADMIGITRATLYRHIDKKDISVERDADGNPKIDVAELIRVYGDRVRPSNENEQGVETGSPMQSDQHQTATIGQGGTAAQQKHTIQRAAQDSRVEMEVLRERVRSMELSQGQSVEERQRERTQLEEQIEVLRQSLEESQEQQKRLTLLITDQREGQGGASADHDETIQNMKKMIITLRRQNQSIMTKLQTHRESDNKSPSFWKSLFG